MRRRRESIRIHIQQTDELVLAAGVPTEVVAALPAGTELNEATKPALTRACKNSSRMALGQGGLRILRENGSRHARWWSCHRRSNDGTFVRRHRKSARANFSLHVSRRPCALCETHGISGGGRRLLWSLCGARERHGCSAAVAAAAAAADRSTPAATAAAALANDVFADNHDADGVILFGELFGGRYPAEARSPTECELFR